MVPTRLLCLDSPDFMPVWTTAELICPLAPYMQHTPDLPSMSHLPPPQPVSWQRPECCRKTSLNRVQMKSHIVKGCAYEMQEGVTRNHGPDTVWGSPPCLWLVSVKVLLWLGMVSQPFLLLSRLAGGLCTQAAGGSSTSEGVCWGHVSIPVSAMPSRDDRGASLGCEGSTGPSRKLALGLQVRYGVGPDRTQQSQLQVFYSFSLSSPQALSPGGPDPARPTPVLGMLSPTQPQETVLPRRIQPKPQPQWPVHLTPSQPRAPRAPST